ncbi:MAG: hypothetical protein OEY94_08275 [Alphaproteobacteria bacterium]|nr:hypothetical protein [Alphaproteobacteria bacterium]
MNFLDELTADQRDLLVSLPYRVGLYVSESDKTGGDESEEREMNALESIITGYAREVFGSETVQYVISETVRRKNEWDKWSLHLEGISADCHKAIDILSEHVDPKEVSSFKAHLVEIGESVALAFREYGKNTPFLDKIKMYFYYAKSKKNALKVKQKPKTWDQFLNISLDERKALCNVAHALGTSYI